MIGTRRPFPLQLLAKMGKKDQDRLSKFKISASDLIFDSGAGLLGKGAFAIVRKATYFDHGASIFERGPRYAETYKPADTQLKQLVAPLLPLFHDRRRCQDSKAAGRQFFHGPGKLRGRGDTRRRARRAGGEILR